MTTITIITTIAIILILVARTNMRTFVNYNVSRKLARFD